MSLEDLEYRVEIRTPVYPTEGVKIVKFCIEGIFPGTEWNYSEGELRGINRSLQKFKEIIKDMRVRATLRDRLFMYKKDDRCSFTLSKQAACNSKVSIVEEKQPLGGVEITIISDEIEEVIEELTRTEETG